jgi:hypothetical protein
MKHLLNKGNRTAKVSFLGETVEVNKLTVAQVESFQAKLKAAKEEDGLSIQREIIRLGVVGADELSDAELDSFPLDDIAKLATEVLRLAGVKTENPPKA